MRAFEKSSALLYLMAVVKKYLTLRKTQLLRSVKVIKQQKRVDFCIKPNKIQISQIKLLIQILLFSSIKIMPII